MGLLGFIEYKFFRVKREHFLDLVSENIIIFNILKVHGYVPFERISSV